MLKYHITAVLVRRSRLSWNAAAIPGIRAASFAAPSSTYTMASSSADTPPSGETLKQQKPAQQGPVTYFPLGYKDAAYQWVSFMFYQPNSRARCRYFSFLVSDQFCLCPLVDQRRAPGSRA